MHVLMQPSRMKHALVASAGDVSVEVHGPGCRDAETFEADSVSKERKKAQACMTQSGGLHKKEPTKEEEQGGDRNTQNKCLQHKKKTSKRRKHRI